MTEATSRPPSLLRSFGQTRQQGFNPAEMPAPPWRFPDPDPPHLGLAPRRRIGHVIEDRPVPARTVQRIDQIRHATADFAEDGYVAADYRHRFRQRLDDGEAEALS